MSIADIRREYARARLDEADVSHDPFVEFARWFAEAQEAAGQRPQRDDAGHVDGRRHAVGPHRAAQGLRRARLRLLHRLPEPEGRRARGQPQGGAGVLLGRAGPAGADHGRRGAGVARGVGALLQEPAARQPARRLGVAPEPGDPGPGGAGGGPAGGRDAVRRRRRPAAAALGRVSGGAGRDRVLAGAGEPAARSDPVCEGERGKGWRVERLSP